MVRLYISALKFLIFCFPYSKLGFGRILTLPRSAAVLKASRSMIFLQAEARMP